MSRLIDLEDRLECAIAHINTSVDIDPWAQNLAVESMRMRIALMKGKQPTIKERKKGKWLPDNNNYYEERFVCSVCGKSYKVDTCMGKPMWDFCPCGADMREEGDHE